MRDIYAADRAVRNVTQSGAAGPAIMPMCVGHARSLRRLL
jgi:hypothetical protein